MKKRTGFCCWFICKLQYLHTVSERTSHSSRRLRLNISSSLWRSIWIKSSSDHRDLLALNVSSSNFFLPCNLYSLIINGALDFLSSHLKSRETGEQKKLSFGLIKGVKNWSHVSVKKKYSSTNIYKSLVFDELAL